MDFLPSLFTDKTITHPDGRVEKKTVHVEKSCDRIAVIAISDQMDGRVGLILGRKQIALGDLDPDL